MANLTVEGLNATINGTVNGTTHLTAWQTLQNFDFMLLELKLVGSAIGIIFLGAHASLRRPPSAAPPKSKKGKKEEDDNMSQGLELSDAIMFPLLAGIMLIGLYYLIQWLKDPAILSKILRYYMTTISVASMVTLYAHGADLLSSFMFPKYWRGWDGVLRKTDQKAKMVAKCDDAGNVTTEVSQNPLPGVLGWFAPTKGAKDTLWKARGLLTREWLFKLFVHGMGEETTTVKFATMMSIPLAAVTALLYFSMNTPFLSNLLGYGMCYCSFMLLSPTDLMIGTLVLVGLFFYDIIMVFYTPYMVTVATTLDVPIKLQFQAGTRQSILGLGDIVIPGMVIAWALRLDLWLFYLRKIKYEATTLQIVEKSASGEITTRTETKHKEVKAPYVNVKGNWGERFWLRSSSVPEIQGAKFPKPYFYATLAGYLAGMLVTLAMLLVFKRGQPALLYLVPGVLGAVYAMGMWRGEVKKIWGYTEDGSLDVVDVVVDLEGAEVKKVGQMKDGVVDLTNKDGKEKEKKENEKKEKKEKEKEKEEKEEKGHKVFYMSLEAPEEL